jgi:hypothetical protein
MSTQKGARMTKVLLVVGGVAVAAIGGLVAVSDEQPKPAPAPPTVAAPAPTVDDAALEEAMRDHRRRYGEPKPFDPEKPTPIDDVGVR